MEDFNLDKKLDQLWGISHGLIPGDPTQAFLDYCHMVITAYRNQEVDSETAGYKLCGAFTPETKFTQTPELEELTDITCDLELGEVSVHAQNVEKTWKHIEELVEQYAKKVRKS